VIPDDPTGVAPPREILLQGHIPWPQTMHGPILEPHVDVARENNGLGRTKVPKVS